MKKKRKFGRKLLGILLTLAMVIGLVPGMSLTAYAEGNTNYVDGSGESQTVNATELEEATTNWTDGSWYIVPADGLIISGRITVNGTVNLILRDGATLTASAGIRTTGATLNIYAQSAGTGALTATGKNGGDQEGGNAGIGGNGLGWGNSGGQGGTVNIYGGTVTATGGNGGQYAGGGAGIGGGGLGWKSSGGQGGTVNIYAGTVTATGGNAAQYAGGGAGIGGGGFGWTNSDAGNCTGGTVNIYGGTVIATGGNKYPDRDSADGAGIGAGGKGAYSGTTTDGTLTLGKGVKLYNGTDNTGTVLDDSDSESRSYSESRVKTMFAECLKGPDKSALNEAITAAETLYNSIKAVEDYSDIATTLYNAIDDAYDVADSETVDQDAIDAATTAITTAKTNAEAAKKDIDDTNEANRVSILIADLPAKEAVTKDNKVAIEAARAAYNDLTDDQKAKVDPATLKKLTDAETALAAAVQKEADDTAAAQNVTDIINALPASTSVTINDKNAIEAARTAYDNLTDDQKAKVPADKLKKLTDAEDALKAAEASDKINALPATDDVTTSDKAAIEAARTAYDALTDAQKAYVPADTLKKLTDAEDKLVVLQVMSEVSAKTGSDVVYTGNPIQLINTPTTKLPEGYKIVYAVTTENKAPTDDNLYSTTIPTATDAGTYYVWYKVVGDDNHNAVDVECVKVTIEEEPAKEEPKPEEPSKEEPITEEPVVLKPEDLDEGEMFADNDGLHFYIQDNGDVTCYTANDKEVYRGFACDGTDTYFFQWDGTAMRDRLTYHPDGEHVIYFDENGHEVFNDYAHVEHSITGEEVDDYCFFNVFGYMYVDVLTWDQTGTKLLYVNPYGVLEVGKWFQFSETVVWADGTGCDGIAGGYGYAMEDATLMRDQYTYDWEGRPCYMQGNGVALY